MSLNCKQYKKTKTFSYEQEEFFLFFILLRSNYSDCYYLDINCSIKALHLELTPEINNCDLVGQPRIKLLDDRTCQIKPEELEKNQYELNLYNTIKTILANADKNKLLFVKNLEKGDKIITCTGVFERRAKEFLFN